MYSSARFGKNRNVNSRNIRPRLVNGKIVWPGGDPVRQTFAFPFYMMERICLNPATPEVYEKLVKSCKYFFTKNPMIVVDGMSGSTVAKVTRRRDHRSTLTMERIGFKIWIKRNLEIMVIGYPPLTSPVNCIAEKLHGCKILRWLASIPSCYERFKQISATPSKLYLCSQLIDSNGSFITIAQLLQWLRTTKTQILHMECRSLWDIGDLDTIEDLGDIVQISVFHLKTTTSLEQLWRFSKKFPNVEMMLCFRNKDIPDVMKRKLEKFVDTILESKTTNRVLYYHEMNEGKKILMQQIQSKFIQ